ncbi:MAG: methyltransferase domain-containing protein [Usitatibacter sp.]
MRALDLPAVRLVEPEWLDILPADDARAIRSRRDLARVNVLMANPGIVARALRAGLAPRAASVAEIGSGDGAFALGVARRVREHAGSITLLDRAAAPAEACLAAFRAIGWSPAPVRADVFEWLSDPATPRFDAIFANLFLHHFERARLAELLRLAAAKTRLFVACEPRRSRTALAGSRLLGLVGCNDVTRHDAVVSVRAGFSGTEISELWGPSGEWHLEEGRRSLFSHGFAAERL